jgi:hypothetical protein
MNENTVTPSRDEPGQDEALRRVADADPAARVEADTVALRTAVDERVAVGRTDELAAARAHRWTSWPARIAGVAAAALVIGGGGGYALGASGTEAPGPVADSISLGNGASGGPEIPSDASGPAPVSPMMDQGADTASGGMARDAYWGYGGRTIFSASGLSDAGGSAEAWAYDPSQVFNEATISRVAAALGLTGAPQLQNGYWQVGPNDGTGPSLTLYPDGTASLSYYDPTKDPWQCVATTETAPVPPAAPDEGTVAPNETTVAPAEPAPAPDEPTSAPDDATSSDGKVADPGGGIAPEPCSQRDLGPAVQGDAAVAAARDLMSAIGVDPAGFELTAEDWGDPAGSYVSASQVVGGQRTGSSWGFSFTGAGVQSLNGAFAPVVSLGTYDVVSPAQAVERLMDPRFGSFGGGPMAYADDAMMATEGGSAGVEGPTEPTLPPTVQPGSPISWPVGEVTIVEARLGAAITYQMDGSAVLIPSYELTSSDGGIWSVIAVVESQLDFGAAR